MSAAHVPTLDELAEIDPNEAVDTALRFLELACEWLITASQARIVIAARTGEDPFNAADFASRAHIAVERLTSTGREYIPKPEPVEQDAAST